MAATWAWCQSVCVGLLACTGTALIMLFALVNDVAVIGTVLVGAIAAGKAVTMSALGMLGILTRGPFVSRFGGPTAPARRWR